MPTRWIFILLLLLGVPALAAPAPPATQPADDLAAMRREAARQMHQRLQSLPSMGAVDPRKLFQIKLENGDLVIQSSMPPTQGPVRVQIEGLHGEAMLNLRGTHARPGPQAPAVPDEDTVRFIQFRHDNTDHDDDVLVSTQVLSGPGYVQIARGIENPEREVNISLIENLQMRRVMGATPRHTVRLYVQAIDPQTGRSTVDLKLSAEDMAQMLRQHPREMAQYIEPILRDLRQDASLFAVEPAVAWQVLAPQLTPDAKATEEVKKLLPALGVDSVKQRVEASRSLKQLGTAGALPMMRLDRAKLSPEQNTRLDALLQPYRTLSDEEARQLRTDPGFLLKCLNASDRAIRAAALKQLKAQFSDIQFDIDAPAQSRRAAVADLREKYLTPATEP